MSQIIEMRIKSSSFSPLVIYAEVLEYSLPLVHIIVHNSYYTLDTILNVVFLMLKFIEMKNCLLHMTSCVGHSFSLPISEKSLLSAFQINYSKFLEP